MRYAYFIVRYVALFIYVLIATVALHAQVPVESPATDHTPSSLSAIRVFSSDVGFDISYPSNWTIIDLSPTLPMIQMKLKGDAKTEAEKSRASCVQFFFSAKSGVPASTFLAVGEKRECIGTEPNLNSYALGTMTSLKKKYLLSQTEYGAFTLTKTVFWIMRTKAAKIDHPDDVETIEYLGAVLPKGVVLWSCHCKDEKAKTEFEHAHLRFADGSDTEMIPVGAFHSIKILGKKPE